MQIWNRFFDCLRKLSGAVGKGWSQLLVQSAVSLSIWALFYRLLLSTFSTTRGLRLMLLELARQIFFTAIRGAHVLIFSALMLGLVVIVHATQHLVKIQGEEFVGWLLVTIVVREVGPVWAAFFVLIHSGSAITVELGTMSVSREIEALKMMGIDPYRLLGAPRLWGLIISLQALYVLCAITAVLGGFLFSQIFAEIFWGKFWMSFMHSLEWLDLMVGLTKVSMFGIVIATVSIYFGFKSQKHMGEVAQYTSQASLVSMVLCGSFEIIVTTFYYL